MTYKTIQKLSTREEKFTTTKQIVEKECPKCGYDRAILVHSSFASAGTITCNNPNCTNIIEEI
jgi:hypothetical protein